MSRLRSVWIEYILDTYNQLEKVSGMSNVEKEDREKILNAVERALQSVDPDDEMDDEDAIKLLNDIALEDLNDYIYGLIEHGEEEDWLLKHF